MMLVADASALIALAVCDSLALLDALFGEVLVPDAVYPRWPSPTSPKVAV